MIEKQLVHFPTGLCIVSTYSTFARKDTRLDTFFKSGISFLCWNDAQNWVLFQLFCYIVFCGGTERCRNGN
jgi:hypothetical protein